MSTQREQPADGRWAKCIHCGARSVLLLCEKCSAQATEEHMARQSALKENGRLRTERLAREAAAKKEESSPTDRTAFDSSAWVGEAPPATPESEGWWWVVDTLDDEERPLPADVRLHNGDLHVRVFGWEYSVLVNRCGLRWGGRLAVPGASPTEKLCDCD